MRTRLAVRTGLGPIQDRSALTWPKFPNLTDFQTKLLQNYEKSMEKRVSASVFNVITALSVGR